MNDYILLVEDKINKTLKSYKAELATIRAMGAHPGTVSHIIIDYYDVPTPLPQLSNIKAPDAGQLIITPFDKTISVKIVKAISEANLGFNPIIEGDFIRIIVPPLTLENRKKFSKEAKTIAENTKIAIRNIRHEALRKAENDDLSENEEDMIKEKVQQQVNQANKKIDELLKEKQQQLETI